MRRHRRRLRRGDARLGALLLQQRPLLRGPRRGQLALGLGRFALRLAAGEEPLRRLSLGAVRPSSSPARRGAVSPLPCCACGVPPAPLAAARVPACASPCRSAARPAAVGVALPGGLWGEGGGGAGGGDFCAGGGRGLRRRLCAAAGLLSLFLAAPLDDADHQQEQEDRDDEPGDEVLDVVADEGSDQRELTHSPEATSFCP